MARKGRKFMVERYLDPTNDVAFKKVFSSKERLKDFLNAVLRLEEGCKITDLDFISQEELPDFKVGRRSLFDIKCVDQAGKSYIVEIQNRSESAFLNRIQCYASHTYVSQAIKGATHAGLMPVILLVLTKHKIFDDGIDCISYHTTLESKTKKQYLFALSYLFIELPKFTKSSLDLSSEEDDWLYFFARWQQDKAPPETIKDRLVLEAYQTIEQFNWSAEEYDAYFRARLAEEAENLEMSKNFEEGRAQGLAEGEAKGKEEGKAEGKVEGLTEGKRQIARAMKSEGVPVTSIAKYTGLSEAEITKL
jgi:predicted transposase/invertase (TIGR01784 family)